MEIILNNNKRIYPPLPSPHMLCIVSSDITKPCKNLIFSDQDNIIPSTLFLFLFTKTNSTSLLKNISPMKYSSKYLLLGCRYAVAYFKAFFQLKHRMSNFFLSYKLTADYMYLKTDKICIKKIFNYAAKIQNIHLEFLMKYCLPSPVLFKFYYM